MDQKLEIIRNDETTRTVTKLTIAKDRISLKPGRGVAADAELRMTEFALKINDLIQPVPCTLRGRFSDDGEAISLYSSHGQGCERRWFQGFVFVDGRVEVTNREHVETEMTT